MKNLQETVHRNMAWGAYSISKFQMETSGSNDPMLFRSLLMAVRTIVLGMKIEERILSRAVKFMLKLNSGESRNCLL